MSSLSFSEPRIVHYQGLNQGENKIYLLIWTWKIYLILLREADREKNGASGQVDIYRCTTER